MIIDFIKQLPVKTGLYLKRYLSRDKTYQSIKMVKIVELEGVLYEKDGNEKRPTLELLVKETECTTWSIDTIEIQDEI